MFNIFGKRPFQNVVLLCLFQIIKKIKILIVVWYKIRSKSYLKLLKVFFIKLVSIAIVLVIVINLIFNLIFADRLEKIDKILFLNKSQYRYELQDKIRKELNRGLNKETLFSEEDKILLYKLYLKIKKEFQNLDKSKI